jgi:bifunctional DNA-binding transcriptional regulator/antitoxin component of YhaV-PrlF toxin-antitoxin module
MSSVLTTVQVGEGGEIALPPELRRAAGIEGRAYVVIEQVEGGILLRPVREEIEIYTPERQAEFLLSNAVDDADYAAALAAVRDMGLDPANIPHRRPSEA